MAQTDPFNLEDDSTKRPGGVSRACPICLQQVAVGVQCSLCHRWYHITSSRKHAGDITTPQSGSPGAGPVSPARAGSVTNLSFGAHIGRGVTGSDRAGGRRSGCVPVPFLMPFFCQHCCRTAMEVQMESTRLGRPGGIDDSPLYGDMGHDDDDDTDFADHMPVGHRSTDDPTAVARRNRELVDRAVSEIAKASEITRSSRAEVQTRWKNLFQPSVLRRTRALFAAQGRVLYSDLDENASNRADPTRTMPEIEPLETDRYEQFAEEIIASHTTKATPGTVSGHLEALERQSDVTLRQQRRKWIGQPLDYANVGTGRGVAKGARPKRADAVPTPPTGSAVRLSHVALRVDGSEDDEAQEMEIAAAASGPVVRVPSGADGAATQ